MDRTWRGQRATHFYINFHADTAKTKSHAPEYGVAYSLRRDDAKTQHPKTGAATCRKK
jgi:hypothetical protein